MEKEGHHWHISQVAEFGKYLNITWLTSRVYYSYIINITTDRYNSSKGKTCPFEDKVQLQLLIQKLTVVMLTTSIVSYIYV